MREYQRIRQYIQEKYLIDIEEVNRTLPRPYLKAITAVVLHKMYSYEFRQISAAIGIHRTTIYHYLEEHEGKYRFHPGYGDMYDDVWNYMLNQSDISLNLTDLKQTIANALSTA